MNSNFTSGIASTAAEWLAQRARIEPARLAYTFLNNPDDPRSFESITYEELASRVATLACKLRSISDTGDRTILLFQPGIDYIVAFYACIWAGLVAVPAYPVKNTLHKDRLSAVIKDCQASVILAAPTDFEKLRAIRSDSFPAVDECNIITDTRSVEGQQESARTRLQPCRTDLAFLQYTSGSTGDPKGVMITHANLHHNLSEIRDKFCNSPDTVMVSWLPPYHDMGLISAILEPLFVGFHCVLMSPFSFIQRPQRWLEAISNFKATVSGGPNFAFDLASDAKQVILKSLDLRSLRIMYSGAEPIRVSTLQRFVDRFSTHGFRESMLYPCYGLAEGTLFSSGGSAEATPVLFDAMLGERLNWGNAHELVSTTEHADQRFRIGCGRALAKQQILIVDPDSLDLIEEGHEGEVCISGPSVARGYWGREELTAQTFVMHEKALGAPLLRTGDLGFLKRGELYITGRIKDTIIVRGRKYYPQDIERAIEEEVLDVKPSCTVAINIGGDEEIAIVAEIQRTARNADPEILFAAIRRAVGRQSQLAPMTIAVIPPGRTLKTSSGKVQRRLTRRMLEQKAIELWARWDRAERTQCLSSKDVNHV